jgi:hypothetical protein
MRIEVKGDKAKCPECGKWNELVFHEKRNQNEFKCCKKYAVLGRINE